MTSSFIHNKAIRNRKETCPGLHCQNLADGPDNWFFFQIISILCPPPLFYVFLQIALRNVVQYPRDHQWLKKLTRIKIIILHRLSATNSTFTDTCIVAFSSCCKEESDMMINFVNWLYYNLILLNYLALPSGGRLNYYQFDCAYEKMVQII